MTVPMTRDKYTRRMRAQLEDLNLTIASLEKRAMETRTEVRETHYRDLVELRTQSRIAIAKLCEIKSASEDSWEKMSTEMDRLRDTFVHSFNDFQTQL